MAKYSKGSGNRRVSAKRGVSDGQFQFAKAPAPSAPRSVFNRSRGLKTTLNAGDLVPIFVDEVLPGDTMSMECGVFTRMATPLHPIFDSMWVDTFFFFVPNRLLWTGADGNGSWQKFMGEQIDPGDSTDYLVPTITPPAGGWTNGSLYDYLGLPTEVNHGPVANLHGRAYNLIWNEWFRSEDLQDSVRVDTDDGPDDHPNYVLLKRGKRHDYFTSCLPFPQKGDPVQLPLGDQAPLVGFPDVVGSSTAPSFVAASGGNVGPIAATGTGAASPVNFQGQANVGTLDLEWDNPQLVVDLSSGLAGDPYADLSAATSATINSIRLAFQTQKLLERDARGGTRYQELLRSHFGVISPDARLQRPEYLGGNSTLMNVNPVAQTSSTSAQPAPQGNLAAFVTGFAQGRSWHRSFTEHGVILGLVSVRANLSYQQGVDRMWSRSTRFDYYWPAFAHLGEQPVLSKEIFTDGTAGDEFVFGYQERWAEYRYSPSKVTGQMRSNFATSLDTWHLSQEFASRPLLNASFIEEDPPISRVIAVPSEPEFLLDAYHAVKHVRPLPTYSVPGFVDHF